VPVAETKLGATAPAAPAPPAPPGKAPAAEREGTPPIAIGAGVALLVLVIVGFLIGHSGGGGDKATPTGGRAVTAGALEFNTPEAWRASPRPASVPGLTFEGGATTVAPGADPGNGTMSTGFTDATGPALLPSGLLEALGEPPALTDQVKLGELAAYRYRNLKPDGFDQNLSMYVIPTTEGVATVACAAPAAKASAFLADCEGAATSLVLTTGDPYPLGVDQDYLDTLDQTVSGVNSERNTRLGALRRAKTGPGQARAAKSLQTVYTAAAKAMGGVELSPAFVPANAKLADAFRATAAAYGRMAAGARANSASRYNRGRRAVSSGEKAVTAALKGLENVGK
jgi:hypothetical protein